MDPFSAMIMAGGGLLGGLMNTSSAQAINSQQLAFAQQQATGGNLQALVGNATKAGVNPLAVIGSGSGAGLSLSNPRPGDAITNAMSQIGKMQSPGEARLQDLQEKSLRAQIRETDSRTRLNLKDVMGHAPAEAQGLVERIAGVKPGEKLTPMLEFGKQAGTAGYNVISGAADYLNKWSKRGADWITHELGY